ncbi:histidine kinase [Paenibacillus sp. J5C_2022]|uniref:sensor histidine kinase n=1 Tax=Paenibacillus sp. J5C2022 TaxID=2977129 RepID=UPI0021D152F0|nr:histidine kinase [Paenibacillus sp. J5C2022]MCU6712489.1 histidine kinase [Paenibacillus sp. J5C2022]
MNGPIRTRWFSSISMKLFVITFFSVICLFLVIGLFGYQRLFTPIRENNDSALQASVDQMEKSLKTFMDNIQTQFIFLSNTDIQQQLNEEDYSVLLQHMHELHSNSIDGFYLLDHGEVVVSEPYSYQFFITPETLSLIALKTSVKGFWWSDPYRTGDRRVITVARQINENRFIALDLNLDSLTDPLIAQEENKHVYLFSESGLYITSNASLTAYEEIQRHYRMISTLAGLIQSGRRGMEIVEAADGEYKVLQSKGNRWGWIVFSIIKENEAYPLLSSLKQQLFIVVLIAVALAAVVSGWVAMYIQKPFSAIIRQLKAGARGDLASRVIIRRSDEFALIASGFNRMMNNIQTLFNDLQKSEERKRHHELKVLHSQVNSHFLNNTLSAIYYLDRSGRGREMGEMIGSLMGLMQYSMDKVSEIVTVEEELKQLDNYVRLMQLRYGDAFDFEVIVPDELTQAPIPKLTLITLVENSIFYGLNQPEPNFIIVTGGIEHDGKVALEVSDRGPGIPEDKLASLLARAVTEETESARKGLNNLGIRSVQDRIMLHFGMVYGLTFRNDEDGGLIVTIRLPLSFPSFLKEAEAGSK